jgi:transcriptional regulator with XRE-family HTH domain
VTTAERMRKARRAQKKRQRDIAEEVGRTQPTVAAWESGRAFPRLEELRRVARAYGLRPEFLIPAERNR